MQDDWPGDPAPLVRYLAEFAAAGADVLRGALPSGEGPCGRNVKVARVHFENVIGVRRIVAADGNG